MKCTIGYFKDNNMDKFSECTLCPVEFITANNGSISQSDCNIGKSIALLKTFYVQLTAESLDNIVDSCCISVYSTFFFLFNLANCSAGNYRDTVSNTCKQCAKGYYQPTQWQTSCIQCPTDKTTKTTGASSLNMCHCEFCARIL